MTLRVTDMTPAQQALHVAIHLGMSFHRLVDDHLTSPGHYVYSSPSGFILANDTTHQGELAVFVTLAAGSLDHFVAIDPRRDERKWMGFCREDDGEVHWIPWERLRKGLPFSHK